jgi:[ribosomal protein S18]-alanine N-acetyltransferase
VIISTISTEHLPAILRLEAENPSPWSEGQWLDELAQPNGWNWAASSAPGSPAGYICGRSILDEAEVYKLAVACSHRRQGIATLLLAHACRELRLAGIRECYLELHFSNSAARALYDKMGFCPYGLRKDYYGAEQDALLMNKKI